MTAMDKNEKISVEEFPDKGAVFCGAYVPEKCACCEGQDAGFVMRSDAGRMPMCKSCAESLYRELGHVLYGTVRKGDTVWELVLCDDGEWRMFPMAVKDVAPFGCVRRVKGKDPTVWNIYAESEGGYTYMYKSYYDMGDTVFTMQEAAEAALRERKARQEAQQA